MFDTSSYDISCPTRPTASDNESHASAPDAVDSRRRRPAFVACPSSALATSRARIDPASRTSARSIAVSVLSCGGGASRGSMESAQVTFATSFEAIVRVNRAVAASNASRAAGSDGEDSRVTYDHHTLQTSCAFIVSDVRIIVRSSAFHAAGDGRLPSVAKPQSALATARALIAVRASPPGS
eukprot:31108-Pelagococcus_subviridis.AAC.2